jgi:hypothetical protein
VRYEDGKVKWSRLEGVNGRTEMAVLVDPLLERPYWIYRDGVDSICSANAAFDHGWRGQGQDRFATDSANLG